MRKLLTDLTRELEAGRAAMLCTVTDSRGSVPRGTGARMLVLEGGEALGTIGGGAVEFQAKQDALALWRGGEAEALRQYDLSHAAAELGMVCGGRIEVRFTVRRGGIGGFCSNKKRKQPITATSFFILPFFY